MLACSLCGEPTVPLSAAQGVCSSCWVNRGEAWVEHCPGKPSELWVRLTPGRGTLKVRCLAVFERDSSESFTRIAAHQEKTGRPLRQVENPFPQHYRCNRCGQSFNGMKMGSGVCYDCWDG